MKFATHQEFVDHIKSACTDPEFIEAVAGFLIDSKNDETKQAALTKFIEKVELDMDGKPNIDEVELLDIYEEMC